MITGKDLIAWGHKPGPWFAAAIAAANKVEQTNGALDDVKAAVEGLKPAPVVTMSLRDVKSLPLADFLDASSADEIDNMEKVHETMNEVMRTPVARSGAVMPDACPAGPVGTIPVGGVVESEHVHPGWHSADVCCSVAISIFRPMDPKYLLDAVHGVTHFGPGGRASHDGLMAIPPRLIERFGENSFLSGLEGYAKAHFGTQGDGNHFAYVGHVRSTGNVALVTHHGSRKPGAELYKRGLQAAIANTRVVAPEVAKQNAWIDMTTGRDGQQYWEALQLIREWTKGNHLAIHAAAASRIGRQPEDFFWNEHNFVFEKGGSFFHAKGATPLWNHHSDSVPTRLIPLNMAEPILMVRKAQKPLSKAMGFAPHGAGRNFSRTEHMRRKRNKSVDEMMREETRDIDARFFSGIPDASELPSAYKSANEIVRQIEAFGLAEIVDYVDPYGCIMAGGSQQPWKKRAA